MAVWSEVNFRKAAQADRFEAEYFQPKFLELERVLSRSDCRPLEYLASNVNCGPFGSNLLKEDYVEDGVVVLRPFNIKDATIDKSNIVFITDEERREAKLDVYKPGDLVFARVGDIGCGVIPDFEGRDITISPNIIAARVKADDVDSRFLSIFMNTKWGRLQMERAMKVMAQPTITVESIKTLVVPEIPENEQRKAIEAFIEAQANKTASKRLYSEAEMLLLEALGLSDLDTMHAITYERDFAEVARAGRFDAEYFHTRYVAVIDAVREREHAPLRRHATIHSGYAWKSEYFIENTELGEPFVRIRDCKPGAIDNSELSRLDTEYALSERATKAKAGDLVIGMDGVNYFYGSLLREECFVNQRVCHVALHPDAPFSSEYAMLVINSRVGQSQVLREMTIAQTVGHITNETVRDLLIPLLSDDLRAELSQKVKDSIAAKDQARSLLEHAKHQVEELIEGGR